jgi:hypothetical protein
VIDAVMFCLLGMALGATLTLTIWQLKERQLDKQRTNVGRTNLNTGVDQYFYVFMNCLLITLLLAMVVSIVIIR